MLPAITWQQASIVCGQCVSVVYSLGGFAGLQFVTITYYSAVCVPKDYFGNDLIIKLRVNWPR